MKRSLKDKIKYAWWNKLEIRVIPITPKISMLHFIDYQCMIDNDLLESYIDRINADKVTFEELKKSRKKIA